jgi:hypothetical protein
LVDPLADLGRFVDGDAGGDEDRGGDYKACVERWLGRGYGGDKAQREEVRGVEEGGRGKKNRKRRHECTMETQHLLALSSSRHLKLTFSQWRRHDGDTTQYASHTLSFCSKNNRFLIAGDEFRASNL